MLHLLGRTSTALCDRISRRDWLQVGGLGILGLSLPSLLRAEDAQRRPRARRSSEHGSGFGRAKACIMLYLAGGPSQPDMWDMKPSAPVEIRGEFKAIATTVPGILM